MYQKTTRDWKIIRVQIEKSADVGSLRVWKIQVAQEFWKKWNSSHISDSSIDFTFMKIVKMEIIISLNLSITYIM